MVLYDTPWENPYTKAAIGIGVCWLLFIGVRHAKSNDMTPERRKNRQSLTANNLDTQIDARNRAFGGKIPIKSNIPFFSRQNHNRRRRTKDL